MKAKYVFLFVLILLLLQVGCSQKVETLTWQEQYDLGVQYLSEGNYKEAILAFNAAIEIDPLYPEAYVQLAEIYTELGDEEKLSEILDAARERFGEDKFMNLFQDEELGHNPLEEEIEFIKNGDPVTVTGVVQYSDESNDIGYGYCFIDGLETLRYVFEPSDAKDGTQQSSTETVFTRGDETSLMRRYVDLTVTLSGKFYADLHGIPYLTDITVVESSGEPKKPEPLVVEEVRYLQKEWTDGPCCFHIPQLNLPGGLGQEFNTQIQQKYNDFSADYFARSCSFDWYQHEDVLTIIVREFANAPCTVKQVYSISVETGKELTDAEILKRCGITEAEFADKVDSYMGEFLQKTVWDLTNANIDRDPEGAQWYTQNANWAVEEAYSEENLKNIKPYIGREGQLCFVFYVPGIVQNGDYFLVNYHTGETYSVPACEDGHGASTTVAEAYPQ